MPSPELESFLRNLQRINETRNRMEKVFQDGRIKKADIEIIYEALFLRVVTSFETFLEKLFFAIMLRKVPTVKGVTLMTAVSRRALYDIVLQRGNYLDWLPYKRTETRASIYLKNGQPFSGISDGDKSQIKTVTVVRNAIAHRSDFAMREFREKVIGGLLLLGREKRPAGFLRSQVRANPTQLRFEVYMSELARIAASLC